MFCGVTSSIGLSEHSSSFSSIGPDNNYKSMLWRDGIFTHQKAMINQYTRLLFFKEKNSKVASLEPL